MPDGEYMLGGQKVIKHGRRATLEDGTTIAGSVANLMDCVRTAVRDMGVRLEDAVRCAAVNPARAVGLEGAYGRIEAGRAGNVVMLDGGLNVSGVIVRGNVIHSRL